MVQKTIQIFTWLMLFSLVPVHSLWASDSGTETQAPYFEIMAAEESDDGPDRFPLKATRAEVLINGVIAQIKVYQTYANQGAVPLNARYLFPAGTRAAVQGLTLTVGDAVVRARIEKRQQARREFESARARGQSAGLLTQQRPNVLQMEVANIMPGEEVRVELVYSERLSLEDGVYEFVFPTVVGPRYSGGRDATPAGAPDPWIPSPYHANGAHLQGAFDLSARVLGGVPLAALSCPSHQIETRWDNPSTAHLRLADTIKAQGDRDFILRYRLAAENVQSGLMLFEGEDENVFMLMVQPPRQVAPEQIPVREFVFVVDVSGSMHGFPLEVAQTLMARLLGGLQPRDRFNVILFAGGSQVLAPRSLPAEAAHIEAAGNFLGSRQGGGGTELLAALKRALALPRTPDMARSVVLISDGYISAEGAVFDYIRGHLDQSNVFSFGIGSSVNRYLMEGVARAGQGEPFVATQPQEALEAARRFIQYVRQPVLTGIEVTFEGLDAYDFTPAIIPDLLAARPVMVMGKWRGAARGTIHIRGMGGQGSFEQTLKVEGFSPRPEHAALPILWARERLLALSDYAPRRAHAANQEAITQLGLRYGLLTAYTAFVAILESSRNLGEAARDVDQPLPLPLGVSKLAVGGPLVAGPEPDLQLLAALLLLGGS
ncbi:MAG: VIT domain-containing protein, partial [Desulfobacterales bacterium]